MLPLLVVLAAAPAASNAIIWSGAPTAEEGASRLEAFRAEAPRFAQRIKLAEGFPKLVESGTVPGLKPGFHVVLLGFCGAESVRARTRALKELSPETYWRPLTAPQPDACPELWCTSSVDMAAVPDGPWLSGPSRGENTSPAFEVDRTEVSRGDYAACVGHKGCTALKPVTPEDPRLPALATYPQAWAYCAAQGKRVVRHDEFEKALRGTDGRTYPWGARKPDCGMASWSACPAPVKPVGSFPAWASPYGVHDLFGNAPEWNDGEVTLGPDGDKQFPARDQIYAAGVFAPWSVVPRPPGDTLGFRCARACTWRPGAPKPPMPTPIDDQPKVEKAYATVVDLALRDALERWRLDRAKALGEGATVEWQTTTVVTTGRVRNAVRERHAGLCFEGPQVLNVERSGESIRLVEPRAGLRACCGGDCGAPTPGAVALRFVEAFQDDDTAHLRELLGPKGVEYELTYNDEKPTTTRATATQARERLLHFGDVRPEVLRCDDAWAADGTARCDGWAGALTLQLKKTKAGGVVTRIEQEVTEGC